MRKRQALLKDCAALRRRRLALRRDLEPPGVGVGEVGRRGLHLARRDAFGAWDGVAYDVEAAGSVSALAIPVIQSSSVCWRLVKPSILGFTARSIAGSRPPIVHRPDRDASAG